MGGLPARGLARIAAGLDGVSADGERRFRRIIRQSVDEEVRQELEQHLEVRVRDFIAAGLDPAAARAEALRRFGNLEAVQRECRTIAKQRERRVTMRENLGRVRQDVGFAARQLARNPGFAGIAVLTLALGIGATTAMFSVVDAVLLRTLPYPGADRVVVPVTFSREDPGGHWSISYADYEDWKDGSVFAHVAVYQSFQADLTGEGLEPLRIDGAVVGEDFFPALGLAPALGRLPAGDEFTPGGPPVVVLSWALWQSAFGADPGVLGGTVLVRGVSRTVIGIAPAELDWPIGTLLWVPLRQTPEAVAENRRRDNHVFSGIARLAPGRSLQETRALMDELARRAELEEPVIRKNISLTAIPLGEFVVGERLSRALWLMLGAVGMVLLIACVNVANLLLTRSTGRTRELSVRRALGAGSGRLTRQLLTESLVLAGAGAGVGVVLASVSLEVLLVFAPATLPRLQGVRLNGSVLAFTTGVTILAALLFGVAPALQASRAAAMAVLRSEAKSTVARRTMRLRDLLVISELALSLLLLVSAGLLVRSLDRLRGVDVGFQPQNLLTFSIALPQRYAATGGFARPLHEILSRVRALPGIEAAGMTTGLPLGGGGYYVGRAFLAEGAPEPPAGDDLSGQWTVVSPGYFSTVRNTLLAGRDFEERDTPSAVPVMIVTRAFAERMFGGIENALGKRVRSWRDENLYREIVGVTEDVRYFDASDQIRPLVYVPHAQDAWSAMVAVLRTSVDPSSIMPRVRQAVAAVDPQLALGDVQTMQTVFENSVAPRRFGALLLTAFAGLALLLATVGIYGVLSYTVTQRTREIGIRIALGARRGAVVRMILGRALAVVLIGIAAGAAAALAATRSMRALLYETSATEPTTFLTTAALLTGVALAASWLAARKAIRVDPIEAIRTE